ncbi:MAG: hypothetical protein V8Q32_06445 [Anaerotignum faecicola]
MGVIPPTADCLLIGDIERSRLPEIKYLFVLGVNEGVLPLLPRHRAFSPKPSVTF